MAALPCKLFNLPALRGRLARAGNDASLLAARTRSERYDTRFAGTDRRGS